MVAGRIVKRHMDDKQLAKHFEQLYKYLDERFDLADQRIDDFEQRTDERFERLETRLSNMENTVDALYKRSETDQLERLAMNQQLDRHNRWHHQAADKLGLQLDN